MFFLFDTTCTRGSSALRPAPLFLSLSALALSFMLAACDPGFSVDVTLDGPGAVASTPTGIDCPNNCAATFAPGAQVTLEAQPQAETVFVGWEGACSGRGACTLSSEAQVRAVFVDATPERLTERFTIVFLPDTQNYVCLACLEDRGNNERWNPDLFKAQLAFVEREQERRNIAFVSHAGDIVTDASELAEWQVADEAFQQIDGKLPFSVVPGDHEYFPEEYRDGSTQNYKNYFGSERYAGESWYVGTSPSGLSHAQRFVAGGVVFLHIGLEFEAPGPVSDASSALGWAKSLLEANPGVPTIITTHAYLMDRVNRRSGPQDQEACLLSFEAEDRERCFDKGGYLDPNASSGEEIFQALVKPYSQVFMVLGGHFHRSQLQGGGADSDNGEYHQVSQNSAGRDVLEMLANYQSYQNGGDGWLRLINFVPGADGDVTIDVETYSPSRDEFQPGSASNFSFSFNLEERFRPF